MSMYLAYAPLRISLFGGGTDYPEYFEHHGSGAVLGTSIDKYSYVTAMPFPSTLFDYSIRIAYREVELVKKRDDLRHPVYREVLNYLNIEKDIELHNIAHLPAFSGLGSSSTFTVSLLAACNRFIGKTPSAIELAQSAIAIEHDILKECVGCQDQTFAAVGGLQLITFSPGRTITPTPITISQQRIEELQQHLLLFFTGITRKASDIAATQIARMQLNLPHLHAMRGLVDDAHTILTGHSPIEALGKLLHTTWALKKQLSQSITNSTIDTHYESALRAGAIGGKILGAGGGGFLLVFVEPKYHSAVRKALHELSEINFKMNVPGVQTLIAPPQQNGL